MESIQIIIRLLVKIIFALLLTGILLWLISIFSPSFNIFSSDKKYSQGWLPAPGSFRGLLGIQPLPKTPSNNDNVFVYNGNINNIDESQVDYIMYTTEGSKVIHFSSGSKVNPNTIFPNAGSGSYANKFNYIRNLSIYEGGHAYTGLSFTGEAKNTMFKNGSFPIIIAGPDGRIVSVSKAQATTNWSVPGWTRFYVKINDTLPNKLSCTMIFQSAETYTTPEPLRVAIPILCN